MRHLTKHSKRVPLLAIAGACAATIVLCLWVAPAAAEHTRFWRQSDYEEFDKGIAKGVALRSDGTLALAPKFAPFADANLAYLWALRMDSKGNVYAAGGSNAKVVRLDAAGKSTTVFDSAELTAQAIVLDKSDNLYVGTSPDGKVYKVTPAGQKSVLFDPKAKYIWDLTLGADGTLYVATGGTGKIFSVTPDGKGDVFYSGEETHIRALALDGKGNLLAGTEPNGLVLRIPLAAPRTSPATASPRAAYVVYETSKREITALVPDAKGNLYVAAIGDKTRPPALPALTTTPAPAAQQPNPGGVANGNITITVSTAPNAAPQPVITTTGPRSEEH